jgi:hypothetical protein
LTETVRKLNETVQSLFQVKRVIAATRPAGCGRRATPFKERTDRREMTDWIPVIIVVLVVVCATAYLLSDPKLRPPRKDR